MSDTDARAPQTVFWHRDLPPVGAEMVSEQMVEAVSRRVPGALLQRDDRWHRCYDSLMIEATARIEQELTRLRGDYAHVTDESIDSRHDDAAGEAWLHGRFTFVMYRDPQTAA
ncbi:MAG: hypothetical protein IT178_17515 [Acidobacteria bacterium]|nr:hypothetical protein [Acidobacteriota bacterium]